VTHPLFFSSLLSTAPPPPHISTLSLHDALPISCGPRASSPGVPSTTRSPRSQLAVARQMQCSTCLPSRARSAFRWTSMTSTGSRSEEHTSELQSPCNLVCRLLLEKKKKKRKKQE